MVVDNKTFEKVVFKNGFEIYRHHDAIPIEGVAEALGLNPKPNGSGGYRIHCPSPDHEDNNPSTDLQINGKYENTFGSHRIFFGSYQKQVGPMTDLFPYL